MGYLKNTIYTFLLLLSNITVILGQNLTINISSTSGMVGDTVCVEYRVENFDNVIALEWVNRFDPNVIALDSVNVVTSEINNISPGLLPLSFFNQNDAEDGFVRFLWFDNAANGITLNDGDLLYTFCFELVGDPCDTSIVTALPGVNGLLVEIVLPDGSTRELDPSEISVNAGNVTIDPDGFVIAESHCSSDDTGSTGSITFAGSGGTGPYDWNISGPGVNESGTDLDDCETATVENLAPGFYTIEFTDANGVVRTEGVTIVASSDFPFILNLDGTDPTCFDRNNGAINVTSIIGGEAPFEYEWSTLEFVEDEIDKLYAGEYSLTITDVNGCTTSASQVLSIDTVKVTYTIIDNPSCDGAIDGIVSFFAEGGTPAPPNNYEFEVRGISPTFYLGNSIIPVPTPFTPANMPAGCFEAIAIDDNNCESEPIQLCLEAGSFGDLTIDSTNVSCNGLCDGQVIITANASGNYAFLITDESNNAVIGISGATTYEATGLCPGMYSANITDNADGCILDTMFIIEEPEILVMSVIDSVGPGCGGGDGMITFTSVGGTMPYTYEWNDAFDQEMRMNMSGGNYSVTVEDANGCTDVISFTFGDGGDIGLSAIVCNAITCESNMDGEICASVTAVGNFQFTWEDSDGTPVGSGDMITGLSGGTYFVTATDGTCTDVASVILAPGQTPALDAVITPPSCANSSDGMFSVSLSEGVNPATFEWSEPPSTQILSMNQVFNAGVGTYNVHITDGNGCEVDTLLTMTEPTDTIAVVLSNIIPNTCFGSCQGGVTINASGGPGTTGEYTFLLPNGPVVVTTGEITLTDLCAGTNFVVALGGICNTDTIFFEIPDIEEISIDLDASSIIPPACNGGDDGSISVVVQGGNNSTAYDLLWVNEGIMGNSLTNLTTGDYILQITDANGCVVQDTINLLTPDPLTVEVNPFTTSDISCFSGSMGQIGLITNGGNTGTITYAWTPDVSNTDIAENLSPGTYSVTVTDVNGCTDSVSYELTSSPPIIASFPAPEEPECYGGMTCLSVENVSGGTGGNYTYSVNVGPRVSIDTCFNVFAGTYAISVFDSAGCSLDTMITVDQPAEIFLDAGPDITIDIGTSTDPVSLSIVSELDIDSILWSPIADLKCNTMDCQIVSFSPNSTTDYTVTVIDENGCFAEDDITIVVDLARNVYTPNIFSPNEDNVNDFFQLATGNGVELVNYLKIFDRWGNMIYQDDAYMPNDSDHRGWDGRMNNQELEPGVYVFLAEVQFVDGVRVQYKGDVTLVR